MENPTAGRPMRAPPHTPRPQAPLRAAPGQNENFPRVHTVDPPAAGSPNLV